MDATYYSTIRRKAWKVEVLDRLCHVTEDVKRAISAAGWTLNEGGDIPQIRVPDQGTPSGQESLGATNDGGVSVSLMHQAQAVVETTYDYIWKTKETLKPLKPLQRLRDLLVGEALMSAYINLHAAESARVLLLSSDQLAAILPSIRQRATAYLPADDPNVDALKTVPDPTQPTQRAVAARVQAQAGQVAPQGHGIIVLTGMLGQDQEVAAQVMNAAYHAEDAQQLQVRHFRGVLYVASFVLLVTVAVLWILGGIHPAYFPLCWPLPGSHSTMICPTGGSAPSGGDVPLVLGMGALGAALSVALNLTALKPAGVHFSLTIAQGLNKIVLGAITAILGIIVLRTVTNVPGFLATQPGLLTTAVIFGYSQQLFTRLIDRQATQLTNAASPATPAAQ